MCLYFFSNDSIALAYLKNIPSPSLSAIATCSTNLVISRYRNLVIECASVGPRWAEIARARFVPAAQWASTYKTTPIGYARNYIATNVSPRRVYYACDSENEILETRLARDSR